MHAMKRNRIRSISATACVMRVPGDASVNGASRFRGGGGIVALILLCSDAFGLGFNGDGF